MAGFPAYVQRLVAIDCGLAHIGTTKVWAEVAWTQVICVEVAWTQPRLEVSCIHGKGVSDLRVDDLRVDDLRVDDLRVDDLRGDDLRIDRAKTHFMMVSKSHVRIEACWAHLMAPFKGWVLSDFCLDLCLFLR